MFADLTTGMPMLGKSLMDFASGGTNGGANNPPSASSQSKSDATAVASAAQPTSHVRRVEIIQGSNISTVSFDMPNCADRCHRRQRLRRHRSEPAVSQSEISVLPPERSHSADSAISTRDCFMNTNLTQLTEEPNRPALRGRRAPRLHWASLAAATLAGLLALGTARAQDTATTQPGVAPRSDGARQQRRRPRRPGHRRQRWDPHDGQPQRGRHHQGPLQPSQRRHSPTW